MQRHIDIPFLRKIEVLDTHTEGNPTRIILGGAFVPQGLTLRESYEWLRSNDDQLRRILNFEPRGNPMMCSVMLIPTSTSDFEADFGAIIMEQDEYVPMCGHCIIGAATAVVRLGLLDSGKPVDAVRFETLAGLVTCVVATVPPASATWVTVTNAASFVLHSNKPITLTDGREIRVDVAFGGDFYAIVDAKDVAVEISPDNEGELGRIARLVTEAVNSQLSIQHPADVAIDKCYEVLFEDSDHVGPGFRHVVVSPPGILDRSPCGTGTSARLASLLLRDQIVVGEEYTFEGVLGTCFHATVSEVGVLHNIPTVVPKIRGRGFVTGHSTLYLEPEDPFPNGLRIQSQPFPTFSVDNI
jgi:proline racemase